MKVMLNPYKGTTLSYRCSDAAVKNTGKQVQKNSTGCSNEEIYNAIMSFKKSITGVFAPKVNKAENISLNAIA